jgi:hypothetical protein
MILYKHKYLKYKNKYLKLKQQKGGNICEIFYNKIPILDDLSKKNRDGRFYITYDENEYEIINENQYILLKDDIRTILKFKINEKCTKLLEIFEFIDCKILVDKILKIYNLSFSVSKMQICEECIYFNKEYIYLNEEHELCLSIKNILFSETYNFKFGISKDLLTNKLYSINFMWIREISFTEICLSSGNYNIDKIIDISSIEKINKMKDNSFCSKLLNFSKNNPNALINFWIDDTQVRTSTIINLRLVFDILNREYKTNICVRNIWYSDMINALNIKYPNILPKCSGFSLILKVDLYKCIICIEELNNHTYSVFGDLDMTPIGEDIILSTNNIDILNEIGLVLTKIQYYFENGFQIVGSTIDNVKQGLIETFNIMMIERTMMICDELKKRGLILLSEVNEINNKKIEQLVYLLYHSMYKFLYYNCGHGLYYIYSAEQYIKLSKPTNNEILNILQINIKKILDKFDELTYKIPEDILNDVGIYISNKIINDMMHFNEIMSREEIITELNKNTHDSILTYFSKLRINSKKLTELNTLIFDDSKNIIFNNLEKLAVEEKHLILFEDALILPTSEKNWPVRMC